MPLGVEINPRFYRGKKKYFSICIGREIVVYNDTVTVTGYNASLGCHILSNGLLMDKEYIKANAPKITPIKAQIDTNTLKVFREMGYQITKIDTTRYGLNP